MPSTDRHTPAELTWTLHGPLRASVADCLHRWRTLDPHGRAQSFLVLHGEAGLRRTLDGSAIAALAGSVG